MISKWLRNSPLLFLLIVSFASFVVYTCMYGFRKPYTVGLYADLSFLGISYKVCLVIAQVLGYMISKFFGIRFIAGMQAQKRIQYILVCILLAWISLLLFAVIPAPYNLICLFLNGLPLGLVFGLVFGFLEGRKTTEIMGAFLASSFIFASGLSKTAGKWLLLTLHIKEEWMPFAAGAIFVIPMIFALWLLKQTPAPSPEDILLRTVRNPMTKQERKYFLKQFGWILLPAVASYVIFTIVRDFCEDFANELWIETGFQNNASIFVFTSTIMSLAVLFIIANFFRIQSNKKAFFATHYLIVAGIICSFLATLLFNLQLVSPVVWMVIATTGLYLAYLPFNCLYFERFISMYKITGNVGFVMYIADAFGYLGTVLVLLIKEFVPLKYSWVNFFSGLFYAAAIFGALLILYTVHQHTKKTNLLKIEI